MGFFAGLTGCWAKLAVLLLPAREMLLPPLRPCWSVWLSAAWHQLRLLTGSFPELAELVRLVGNCPHLFFSWVSFLLG